jgi:putative PIG3 family NAD(P)H quinone oxidoreductase
MAETGANTALPDSMTAIGIAEPGGPEMLRPETIPMPVPRDGEVLIRVSHAGVNRPDVVQRLGAYPPPPGASPIPGLEVAGEVVATGDDTGAVPIGSKVCALVTGGGYAQYCIARAAHCLPVPADLPMEQAAALPETLFTVWHNVFERGFAREGETILVHGGTSGIGTMAIMLCKQFGMQVIVTCGSDDKCAAARDVGADHAINYRESDFVDEIARITGKSGVDLVLDMVAGDYVARNMKCLKPGGRHVTIAVQGGMEATINMAVVMQRRYTLTGSTLRPRDDAFKALLAQEILENAWPLIESGAVRPVMDRVFPLDQASEAHRRMEDGAHIGKIVLRV